MTNLKSFAGLPALLFFTVFLMSACTEGPVDVTREIQDANKVFMETRDLGDAEALSLLYTSDAKIFPSNGTAIEGREAIRAYWIGGMEEGSTELILETVMAEGYGEMAIEEGRYLVKTGDQVLDRGKYIVSWKKKNGQWLLHWDMWNSDLPLPQARASANETMAVVLNRVKPDKVQQFEEFNFTYLEPAVAEYSSRSRNTIRCLRPKEANADGSYSYFYLLDPSDSPEGYGMGTFLTAKFGTEKSNEYMLMFKDCLVDGMQEIVMTEQTSW